MSQIGTLEVAHESMVVFYDGRTGRIVHTHKVVTFEGGEHPDRKTIERDALEQLRRAQPKFTKKPEILHIDPRSVDPDKLYKIDPKKRVLVEQRR